MQKNIWNREEREVKKATHLNAPIVTILGKSEIYVENYKGIIEYSNQCIRLNTSVGILSILGSEIWIREMNNESIKIYGDLDGAIFKG
ncbi:MAG: YabP/YqfC family sporulation protein [Lachnospirales bacterium]